MDPAPLRPHSPGWYDRLAGLQEGYFYPWRSHVAAGNGEDAYLELVHQHLTPETDLLDVACGHGEVALGLAPRCRSVFAYDRVASYIELAEAAAARQRVTNVTFRCHDSSIEANDGRATIPAPPGSFDLLISRRGPFHWLEDARRVARPGAVLLALTFPGADPLPPWNAQLPAPWRRPDAEGPTEGMREAVERRLAIGGLALHSAWTFDVPEVLPNPEQFYRMLAFGSTPEEIPTLTDARPALEQIFVEHGTPEGLIIRHRRLLWKAVVPA
jgi:SAM-dependent methyltransferase